MTVMANTPETGAKAPVSKFSKGQILRSKRYGERRDLLSVLLEDKKAYSHAEVEKIIDDFMKGKVK